MYRSGIKIAEELSEMAKGICFVSCKLNNKDNAEWMTELEVYIRNLRDYVNPAVTKVKLEEGREERKLTIKKAIKNIADALEESGEEFIAQIYEQATGVKAAFEREPCFITVWGLTEQEIQEIGEENKFEETRP